MLSRCHWGITRSIKHGLVALAGISFLLYLFAPRHVPQSFLGYSGEYVREAHVTGQWGPSIPVSLVPVAGAVLAETGRVLVWAADNPGSFGLVDRTVTAIYDPATGTVSDRNVSATNHNMFCPGVSLDLLGRPVVTGGSTSSRTSIYDERQDSWESGPPLSVGRGYHAQATLSDGRIFTIGGSWSGGVGGKNGEVFDPTQQRWVPLSDCPVETLLTNDDQGLFASDNHPWLFAWKNASVLQAGPSRAMTWYSTYGSGGFTPAGHRGADGDSMNGNAVMFDAGSGRILTLGGAPSYRHAFSTRAAHLITLSDPFVPPDVEELRPMRHPRAYANSVVLPTGDVFVNGGVSYALQWTDENATWIPELWRHESRQFLPMARMPIPRTYHSMAVLLPDATVLTGGGGLCWEPCHNISQWKPESDHFNLQVFYPPYLFGAGGKAVRQRPQIIEVSNIELRLGEALLVTTDARVNEIALVRYASATHSINTDQRRIRLDPIFLGHATDLYTTTDPRHAIRGVLNSLVQSTPKYRYEAKLPADPGIAIPGYWMLFALDMRQVPSIAKTILIRPALSS